MEDGAAGDGDGQGIKLFSSASLQQINLNGCCYHEATKQQTAIDTAMNHSSGLAKP
jgi:hypothetical protein